MYVANSTLPDPMTQPEFYQNVPTKRFLAWCLDMVLIIIACVVLTPFTAFTALFFFPFLVVVVGFVYRWATLATGSATLGMRLMSIEIRRADGTALDGTTALLHTLGYSASITMAPLQVISIILMLVSERKQGLSDHVLGTTALNRGFI